MEIVATDLLKIYGRRARRRTVVNGVTLSVAQGEVVGLLGPNGAGKTTTFYMIVGLLKPNRGQVLLDGQDITRQPMYRRARFGIGYLPQEASVFRNLTVEQNLQLVLELRGMTRAERKARADAIMEDLHIAHRRDAYGSQLSGGERRRTEIARALAADPKFILLDEPFTGVDPKAIEDVASIIQTLSKRNNIGILITDHNVHAMLQITERAYIIADGQVRFQDRSDKLLQSPEARAFYFGERYGEYLAALNPDEQARRAAEDELRRSLDTDPEPPEKDEQA